MPIALVSTLLAACSSSEPTTGPSGVDCTPAGAASSALKIEGDFGTAVTLASDVPVTADALERSVLIQGDGEVVQAGDEISTMVTYINGTSGDVLNSQQIDLVYDTDQIEPWAFDIINCSSFGDRVAAVAPVVEVLGAGGGVNVGMEDTDSFVLVFDFLEACEALTPRDANFPEVDLGDGTTEPVITIPACMEPPAELEIEVLVEGDGPVVEADQNIMTNYVGVDWDGAVRFDGNWSETGIQFSTAEGALISGFTQAMVGQKIGSTILVTMPSELGYNDGMTRTFVLQLVSVA